MRIPLWTSLLLVPTLCLAQAEVSQPPKGTRIMALQPTQTVEFEGSLPQLRTRLQVTGAQEAAWTDYERSVQAYSNLFFSEKPLSATAAEPAPRQVELLLERMQKRVNAVADIARTAKTLYALLNAEQQKIADRYLMASIPSFGNPPDGH